VVATMWEFDARMGRAHLDLIGFEVVATDGPIGRIDAASDRVGAAFVLVDTRSWLAGTKRLLPAGLVRLVNENDRAVHVSLSRDEIRQAPAFDEDDLESPDLSYDVFFQRFLS
jgi:hypothetical protein